jgi:hypothetical protein
MLNNSFFSSIELHLRIYYVVMHTKKDEYSKANLINHLKLKIIFEEAGD